jgi:hypothetical protein
MSAQPVAALTRIEEANDDGFPGDCSSCTVALPECLGTGAFEGSGGRGWLCDYL